MRKVWFWLIISVIVIVIIAVVWKSGRSTEANIKPEVLNISTSQAAIAWISKAKYKGSVSYVPAGDEIAPLSATENFGASDQHEVVLTGLRPSTRYTYWLDDSPTRFQFQSQPAPSSPFSFLIVWGDISDRIVSLLRSEAGEFIISLTPSAGHGSDMFSNVRPYVPVYGLSGVDSPFLKAVGSKPQTVDSLWKLDWGGLRLIFVGKEADSDKIAEMLSAPSAHTIGIITSSDIISAPFGQSKLHSMLVGHNKQQPTRPAAFVAIVGSGQENSEIDGVRYFGIDTARRAGAARVDIDVESARAVFVDENREVALKQPPLKQKRTCEECRRLADKGAYEASVKAYIEFIETHKGNYQIDDAYFAIADIYDSKLFDFKKAQDWYRLLIAEYPDGTFTSLANQRIKYISAYSDYDYKPLASFERIKAIEFARKKEQPQERSKIFDQVRALIKQYPDSNVAPVMQHWLANQYRLSDPNKAVEAYMALRKNYRGNSQAQEVMVEIGETYYDAGRYKEAIKAYSEALNELPAMADTIRAQITRSERNIRRDKIAYACWAIVAVTLIGAVLKKPQQTDTSRIIWSVAAFAVVWAALSFAAWLIHEQFNSTGEMVWIVFSFSAITALSALISMKFTVRANVHSVLAGTLVGIVFFLAGIYLAIYYIYVHYLIVVKL
jgi:tetratricopeptide (TPR) repeat protein